MWPLASTQGLNLDSITWALLLTCSNAVDTFHILQDCDDRLDFERSYFWNGPSEFLSVLYPSWKEKSEDLMEEKNVQRGRVCLRAVRTNPSPSKIYCHSLLLAQLCCWQLRLWNLSHESWLWAIKNKTLSLILRLFFLPCWLKSTYFHLAIVFALFFSFLSRCLSIFKLPDTCLKAFAMKTEAQTSEKTLRHSCATDQAGIWTNMAQLHFLPGSRTWYHYYFALLA